MKCQGLLTNFSYIVLNVAHPLILLVMSKRPSAFDPAVQADSVPAKLVASLDRLSQALRSLLWEETKTSGLSPIQIQLLIHLRFHQGVDSRVGDLAGEFDLASATVSEALTTLVDKGLVKKEPDPADGRARVLRLTARGKKSADRIGGWADVLQQQLGEYSEAQVVVVMRFLMDLIAGLQEAGIVSITRMCSTCRFFERTGRPGFGAPHYCALLEKPLREAELRLDCPEHEAAA